MSETILVDASVEVDDEPVTISGDSIVFVEGLGEKSVTAASKGGKSVVIISEDISTKIGQVKFEMPATIESINSSREFATKGAGRVVRISGTTPDGTRMGRTLTQAIMTTDPEKQIQNDGKISVEFMGAPLVTS